jgi:muramoyltetrapeptide carboxypeptidase
LQDNDFGNWEHRKKMKIGICAPSAAFERDVADRVMSLASDEFPSAQLHFHDQCFFEAGHFAGTDEQRLAAFVELANDPSVDAIWFARGGYGAGRIAADAVRQLNDAARDKAYLGYSDGGFLLAELYRNGIGRPVHGPVVADIKRAGGEDAVRRALSYLVNADATTLEPHMQTGQQYAAFNLMTLAMMTGTALIPDLSGHVLMVEEVSEYLYAFDRAMGNVTSYFADKELAGIMLGEVSDIPENDRAFGEDAQEITQRYCAINGIAFLGRANIGHSINNRIVPFGRFT